MSENCCRHFHVNPGSANRCRECGEPIIYVDGELVEDERHYRRPRVAPRATAPSNTYKVPSSSGGEYTVTETNGVWACECEGYRFKKTCRHIDAAKKMAK